jgi:ribonuclease-3
MKYTIEKIKKTFVSHQLIEQALTHRSWVNEHPGLRGTNERLEFLGDAVLEFVVSKALFLRFPKKEEGYLTALRANLVNTISLSDSARTLKLGKHIYLSKGEEETGGRDNPSLLADTMEAIIGAIYLDQGINASIKFIKSTILNKTDEIINKPLKDAKSRLQESIQARGLPTPKYTVVNESGPDHNKKFIVEVSANGDVLARGEGKSKSDAEQDAATKAIDKLL